MAATVLMLVSAVAAMPVVATDGSLDFEVTQDDDFDATVTVTHNGSTVAGANVTVEAVPPGRDYNSSGRYVTDENGTVTLPAPEDDLLVEIAVRHNNSTVSDQLVLKANETDTDDLRVGVTQNDDYTATVTVTENATPAPGANVTVETVLPDGTYGGTGDYWTDENGTVTLPVPEDDVKLRVRATFNNSSNATVTDLEAPEGLVVGVTQHDDLTATVTVTDNETAAAGANVSVNATSGNYSGEGEYMTDANGTLDLPAPNETVDIAVTAEFDNDSATTTATLLSPEEDNGSATGNFGQQLTDFIMNLGDFDGPRGLEIADFVLENNPGNPPDHAGPPADHPLRSDDRLDIQVRTNNTTATVSVTDNGTAAPNATVDVSTLGNGVNFTGAGTYTADSQGTVTFALPAKPTMTVISAEFNNSSTTERVQLSGTESGPPDNESDAGNTSAGGPPSDAGPPGDDSNAGNESETTSGDDNAGQEGENNGNGQGEGASENGEKNGNGQGEGASENGENSGNGQGEGANENGENNGNGQGDEAGENGNDNGNGQGEGASENGENNGNGQGKEASDNGKGNGNGRGN